MPTYFDSATYQDLVRRVEALAPDAPRQWGTMTPAQMLEHATRVLEMAAASPAYDQIFIGKMISWMFKKNFLGPKPFGKNAPTGPAFVAKDKPDFAATKARLLEQMAKVHGLGEAGCDGHVHAFFGRLTGAEWGVSQYKHLDHHLRQFGA